jgi:hypothetical protein
VVMDTTRYVSLEEVQLAQEDVTDGVPSPTTCSTGQNQRSSHSPAGQPPQASPR